ncbi:malate dehydrogenase, mitochondrial-like [Pectinophora gossypiella]|uniref:malate dehydrogenase, mitochondrial-like n=1 Tax=Pectinophora gossypiella TaxID=13191 RepID=UPI00214F132F|nr:malate dehydrogenase, mitochondrial-like [Pectinophora gossypiella]
MSLSLNRLITRKLLTIFTTSKRNFKVAVLGASGGIGQPLALLLKQNPLVSQLALYDVSKITPGVAVDLSHMNTCTLTEGFTGEDQLCTCLYGSSVVIIPAGLPRKPGMSRDDLFKSNAGIIANLTCAIARFCPCAMICIITNPVNACVPIASEIMCKCGVYDPNRIFGVTTLDLVRASTFVAEVNLTNPTCQYVPVIGGHAGATIIPLLSRSCPPILMSGTTRDTLTKRIQEGGTEVVAAKAGGGSATLSMAFAAARFANAILRGLNGEENVVEPAYVKSNVTASAYFSTPLLLGRCGIKENLGIGKVDQYEQDLICKAVPMLQKSIKAGVDFVKNLPSK